MTQIDIISRATSDADERAGKGHILIIDDEVDWVAECGFMLQSFDYHSHSAMTVEEAIVQIADDRISTVIIDYNMPGCDGLTLIHELAARAATDGRQLNFIMATGHATVELAIEAMRASAVDFLQKPVSRDDLKKALLRINGVQNTPPARSALVDRLAGLSAEMNRLANLIGGDPIADTPRSVPQPAGTPVRRSGQVTADFIRGLLRTEAKRRKLGNGVLFGDPSWDMLLDLLVAKLEGRQVSVSSACIASGAPTTTALRLVNRLVGDDILNRIPDERDGRRDFLVINPQIEAPLLAYLDDLAHS
jgi:FixJ family two-component response regulator